MSVHVAAAFAALLVVLAAPGAGAAPIASHTSATAEYGIVVGESVHTPVETIQLGDVSVDVSSTSAHSGYEPLNATITHPADGDGTVRVELFDAGGERRATVTPSDGTVSIPTASLSSGTYYLVVRDGGAVHATERVVLSRYDVTVSIAESESTPAELVVRVVTIPGGDTPYRDVEVVATDGSNEVVTTASEVRMGLHEATVERNALPPGEYAVYARLVGRPDPYVGMSAPVAVTVDGDASRAGQSATTDTVSDVDTESVASTTTAVETTSTQFPETGIVLLIALALVSGVALRLRRAL